MACFKLVGSEFEEVEDPVSDTGSQDYNSNIYAAGYLKQFSSALHDSEGAEVTIYSRLEPSDKPRFYIDVSGMSHQVACLVADDFAHLVKTMKEIAPLVAMAGLDQQASLQADEVLRRESQ